MPNTKHSGGPQWLPIANLILTGISLAVSSTVAIFSYRIDAKTKAFEANGYLDTDYEAGDIWNHCADLTADKKDVSMMQPDEQAADDRDIINIGYVKNPIWREATSRMQRFCKAMPHQEEYDDRKQVKPTGSAKGQNIHGYFLATLKVSSKVAQFDVSPTLHYEIMPAQPGLELWKYQALHGQERDAALGPIRKGFPKRFPVAILDNFSSNYGLVYVPRYLEWVSPITGETVKLPLTFVTNGNYWVSKSAFYTASGGPVYDDDPSPDANEISLPDTPSEAAQKPHSDPSKDDGLGSIMPPRRRKQ